MLPDWAAEIFDALGDCPALSNGAMHDLWCPVTPGARDWQAWTCAHCHRWVRMSSLEWASYDVARQTRRAAARQRRKQKE